FVASDSFVLTVQPSNRAPSAQDDGVYVTTSNREVVIDRAALLANDVDPDGDVLAVTGLGTPATGEVRFASDGNIVFVPDAAFVGTTQFTYTVSDGEESSTATVTVKVDPSDQFDGWRSGNDNSDILLGSLFGTNRVFGAGG